jgi:hypothetical protein
VSASTLLVATLLTVALIFLCLFLAGLAFLIHDHITHRHPEPDPEPPPWPNDVRCWPRPRRRERCER